MINTLHQLRRWIGGANTKVQDGESLEYHGELNLFVLLIRCHRMPILFFSFPSALTEIEHDLELLSGRFTADPSHIATVQDQDMVNDLARRTQNASDSYQVSVFRC
jgi:hypothetical protein